MSSPHIQLRTYVLCFCLLNVDVTKAASAGDLKTISPTDIADIQKVSDPQISPDGKRIAYVVELPEKSGAQKNAHIWLISTDRQGAQCPFVMSSRSDTSPRWSPDGK